MFRPDPLAPLSPEALAAQAFAPRPAPAAGGGGAAYGGFVDPVAREVRSFIDAGLAEDAGPLASTPEGRWHALQASRVGAATANGAPLGAAQQAFLDRIAPW